MANKNLNVRTKLEAFAIFEVLIALTIIAILAVCSMPMLQTFSSRTHTEIVQAELLDLLALARRATLVQHVPIVICASKDHHRCDASWKGDWLVFIKSNQAGTVQNPKQMLAVMPSPRHGILYWRSFHQRQNYLLFLPDAMLFQDNSTFWYCPSQNKNPAWAIILNRLGRVRVVYPQQGVIQDGKGERLRCDLS